MSHRRPVVLLAVAVVLTALATATSPPPTADAVPASEVLPPYFAPSSTDSPYTITVNGVEMVSDATGFNHWGGDMALYAARTGLLVEADRVRIRVEAASAFSVGLQIFVCDGEGCDAIETSAIEGYDVAGECDASSAAVVVPELTSGANPNPYDYLNNRRAFLVGDSAPIGPVHRFDCSLEMAPGGGLDPIATIFLEVGAPATFRAEAAQFITGRAFDLDTDFDGQLTVAEYDGIVAAAGCTYLAGNDSTDLATAINDGGTETELASVLDCPDGRIDLYDVENEAHVLPAYANPRAFAADFATWRAVDATDPDYDPYTADGTLRVPACDGSPTADEMPCYDASTTTAGWGVNVTDVTIPAGEDTEPSVEITLVRTSEDSDVGYGTVAQAGVGDRVTFALRVPTGTVRGVSWANMARPAGYLFAEVAAYDIDITPVDHVVLTATLEPRERSSALDAATYGFQCLVTVGGGASSASDCDIPAGALDVDQLRMHPRAWISAVSGSTYRATKKVLGWRVDTASCDAADSTPESSDDCDAPGVLYDVPDPDAGPTVTQEEDRLYTKCREAVYTVGDEDLSDGIPAGMIYVQESCGTGAYDVATRETYLEVRDSAGERVESDGRPTNIVQFTDAAGDPLLFTDFSDPTNPVALTFSRSTTKSPADCDAPSPCFTLEAPAIRAKLGSDDDSSLAVYDGTGIWTHTLVQTVTPACIVEGDDGCQQGRRIDWLSATDGSDDWILPLGDSIVSIMTETPHGYQAGDSLLLGGVESSELDGLADLTVLDTGFTSVSFTADASVVSALTTIGDGDPNDCARDGSGFLEQSTLCGPDVDGFEMNPSRMILRTTEPHGFGAAGTVLSGAGSITTTLLGNEFDGTYEAIVVDDDEVAIDGSWFATDAYVQARDGVLVRGQTSKVVITETTLTMYLDGLPEEDAAIAGGFVATNGQTFTFGEDMRAGRAFDFALAGPSRDADGRARDSDGFFQAFIPQAFLGEAFDLTVAGAVNALEVNRRNAGSVGTVSFAGDPSIVTGGLASGLLISSDGFSYSAPYFAAERRETPQTQQETGATRGPVTLPGGAVPTVAPGARTATVGGRVVVPTAPVVTTERMELSLGSSSLGLGGPGALGGLAVRSEGGQQVVELQAGSSFAVTGDGFQPGSLVETWLFSEPQLLALARVDDAGGFTGEVPLDGWSSGAPIPPGRHTLQISGVNADGEVVAFSVGVEVVTALTPPARRVSAGASDPVADPAAPATGGGSGGGSGSTTPTTPEAPAAQPTPDQDDGGTDASDEVAVVTAAEPSDGGGGAMRSLGLLAGVLAVGLLAYGIVASRRRRASS
jgi:hypothetical protein